MAENLLSETAADPGSVDDDAIPLVLELCDALDREHVRYCHWKSNAFLDRSARGENDLDLLVLREDADRFLAAAYGLGFKQASARSPLPGVFDLYGYDARAGKLVHLHAHYRLVVGDDLTKNYRIPLENTFLDSATRTATFPVPAPELELVLLVIRLTLKHSTWDARLARRGDPSRSAREELAFLSARADDAAVHRTLIEHLAFVEPVAFDECRRQLEHGVGRWRRIPAGNRLAGQLQGCARRPRATDVRLKLWRSVARPLSARVLGRRAPRKRLTAGGALVALVGADGAGKSTLVEGLAAWLGKDLVVRKVHLGRPPRSPATALVTAAAKAEAGVRVLARGRRARTADRGPSTLRLLHAVAVARDRRLAYRAAHRAALAGAVVVCDRFPLPELTSMDAPRVPRIVGDGRAPRLAGRLAALERRYYRDLVRPDVVVVLRVDPEVAVGRKPDEPADFVRSRWRDIWDVDWEAVGAHVVDADRPAADVLRSVKALVWSEL